MVPGKRRSNVNSRPVINRRSIIIIRWRIISCRGICRRCVSRRRLIHIKINLPWNIILRREHLAGMENSGLNKLIRMQRERLNHIFIRTKVVERSILIAEDFYRKRRGAHELTIYLDPHARFRRFHRHVVGNRPIGTLLRSWRNRFATNQENQCRTPSRKHPLRIHNTFSDVIISLPFRDLQEPHAKYSPDSS